MSEILLVNPARRGRKKARTPKQKAATRRLVAGNKKRGKSSRRASPVKRRRKRNPIPGRRSASRTRRRANPTLGFNQRNVMQFATAAATGAAGAIALDVALAYLPLPVTMKTGVMGKVTKAVGAIALGVAAKATKLVSNATARDMTVGALTVQFTGIGRDLLGQFAPGVALAAYIGEDNAGLAYAGSGWNPSASLDWSNNGMTSHGMGAYTVGEGYDIAAPGDGQPGLNEYESEQAFGW